MSAQTHKDILPQFKSVRPTHLYKQWTPTDSDITTQPNLKKFMSASAASASHLSGTIDDYYNYNFTGSVPNFPGINVKYARFYPNETGSLIGPNTNVVDDDDYVLSYNYKLGNGDRFYPLYESQSGYMNPDGTYYKIVHYSLRRLFYGGNATYHHLLYATGSATGSVLRNEAFVFEIPQRYVADRIEPGKFLLTDSSDIFNLPYCSSSVSWSFHPHSNTIDSNSLASEGIRLYDDGFGNIFDFNYTGSNASASIQRGNIFYNLGIVVITDVAYARYFRNYLIISGNIL